MIGLPNIATMALAGALVAALAGAGVQTVRLSDERADHAATKAQNSEVMRAAAMAHAKDIQAARDEDARREAAKQKEVEHAQEQRRAAVAAAARADRAADGLRDQLAAFVSAAKSGGPAAHPITAGGSPTAGAELELLADVLRGVESAGRAMAAEADAFHGAGRSCERSADALTPKD